MQGAKSAYRGLGSIDFRAAARSVLLVGRSCDDDAVRVVVHDKSSLAPEGASILFSLHSDTGFSWNGFCDTTATELLSGSGPGTTKTEQAEHLLLELLKDGGRGGRSFCRTRRRIEIGRVVPGTGGAGLHPR